MMRSFLFMALALCFATPALAEPSHGGDHAPSAEHGGAHNGDDHGSHAGGDHGEGEHGGGHHVLYTADDDDDGIANWLDPQDGLREETPEAYVVTDLFFHFLNLAILIGLLWWALRKPIQDVFRDRSRRIKHELVDSTQERDQARERHEELVARLGKIESEMQSMQVEAATEADREEQKLIERAEREAERIAEQARRSVRDEATRARQALRRDAVALAVQLAEDTLRSQVASTDQRALAQDFLDSLKNEPPGATHG